MSTSIYEDISPSLIENTTMKLRVVDGIPYTYRIAPIAGYVLHDKGLDAPAYDEVTLEPTGEILLGFRRTIASCAANYDFVANPREFYTVPKDNVLENEIRGEV